MIPLTNLVLASERAAQHLNESTYSRHQESYPYRAAASGKPAGRKSIFNWKRQPTQVAGVCSERCPEPAC